jgi:hypothetical protein
VHVVELTLTMASTMLRPLIGRMVAFGLIMFSLQNPTPAAKVRGLCTSRMHVTRSS